MSANDFVETDNKPFRHIRLSHDVS